VTLTVPCWLRIWAYGVACLWWSGERPPNMYRRERGIDERVAPDEYLYYRWFSNWVDSDRRIHADQMKMPDFSANRSGHGGRSWYVLLPEPNDEQPLARRKLCQGIVCFRASEIPLPCVVEERTYVFAVEHDPLEHNYQHCEICVYHEGSRVAKEGRGLPRSEWKQVKKHFRTAMREVAKVYVGAETTTNQGRD